MTVRGSRGAGRRRLACQTGALLAMAAWPALAQDAASQIRTEIQRMERSLQDKPLAVPDMPNANSMVADALKAASDTLAGGHLYASLEALGHASGLLQGLRFIMERRTEIEEGGMPAFQAEWKKVSLDLTALDKHSAGTGWSRVPAAVRALSEVAQTRARPLLEGGLGFATANGPKDGLFYLGQAEGEAGFARFCASLKLTRRGAPPPLRSLLPELQRLQEKTNAAFQPPRSIDLHPRFIALNATLKLAQELDAAKFHAGALYEYLEATRHYGMLDAPPLDDAGKADLKRDLAAAHAKLDAASGDNSIAQALLERADTQATHADGSAPSSDEWRSARVIVDQVLPAYFAAQGTAPPLRQSAGKTIDITLVRWPYT